MKARDRGYRQGYRSEIRGLHMSWENVNGKWWDGYCEGQRDAANDLKHRLDRDHLEREGDDGRQS